MEEKTKRVQLILRETQKVYLESTAEKEGLSLSALVRKIVDQHQQAVKERELLVAARSLYAEYETDPEATIFTALDGDEFA